MTPGTDGFAGVFCHTFKEEITSVLYKLFQKIEKEEILCNSFYEASISLIPKPDKDIIRIQYYRQIPFMNLDAKIFNKIKQSESNSK